jgi:diguanylate cyclase (GGDEF)-like protein
MTKKDNERNRLFEILNNEIFTAKFIAGIAGDRILNRNENELYKTLLDESGGDLYVNLLFYITHQVFGEEKAKKLWEEILVHKTELSNVLNRNVEISVATLDYLTNIKDEIKNPKLIGEAFIGKIAEMASNDGLTKLYNKQYVIMKIGEEITRYKRYGITFSILIIDIDNFKTVNDRYGHQKGDSILSQLSMLLKKNFRDLDICSRYGGDEFIIVLPHTDIVEAKEIAERFKDVVDAHFSKTANITISAGLSNCPDSASTMNSLIGKADEALYESKKNGRNRVTLK